MTMFEYLSHETNPLLMVAALSSQWHSNGYVPPQFRAIFHTDISPTFADSGENHGKGGCIAHLNRVVIVKSSHEKFLSMFPLVAS